MGNFDKAEKPRIPMQALINLNGVSEVGRTKAALAMMRRRARRGDPEAALHILNHIVRTSRQTRRTSHEQRS